MIENIFVEDELVTFSSEKVIVPDESVTCSIERTYEVETPRVEIGYLGNSIVRYVLPLKIKILEFYGGKC